MLDRLIAAFRAWIDAVACVVAWVLAVNWRPGAASVRVVEAADGAFTLASAGGPVSFRLSPSEGVPAQVGPVLSGRLVELVLAPARFVVAPLELPQEATPFLQGIVQAQMDRLTPWSAADAAFGHTPPEPLAEGRMGVTVVATPRVRVVPLVAALKGLGARSVTVHAAQDDGASLVVMADAPSAMAADPRIRRGLLFALWGLAGAAALCLFAADWLGAAVETERDALRLNMERARAQMAAQRAGADHAGVNSLTARKREVPAALLVLEHLSALLPDDTYVSELRMEGDKLEFAGLSREAPGLIRRLEQSQRFAEVTFIAPTLRQAGEAGERFHLAARIVLPQELPQ